MAPYWSPPFVGECEFHRFGEGEAPDLAAYPDDPLCVEYAKGDAVGKHLSWVGGQPSLSAHPPSSCRIGDDPATSALTPDHELRGSPGLFLTDGSAVPTSLTVDPSLTIASLAERASAGIARCANDAGIAMTAGVPAPGRA